MSGWFTWKMFGNPKKERAKEWEREKTKVIAIHSSTCSFYFSSFLYIMCVSLCCSHSRLFFSLSCSRFVMALFCYVCYIIRIFDNYGIHGEKDPNQIGFKGYHFILKYFLIVRFFFLFVVLLFLFSLPLSLYYPIGRSTILLCRYFLVVNMAGEGDGGVGAVNGFFSVCYFII